jgi:signal peptidase II
VIRPNAGAVDEAPPPNGSSSPDAVSGRGVTKWSLAFAVAAAALAVDLLSKRLAQATDFRAYEIAPFLTIQRQVNRGVAFGLFWERYGLILGAAAIALAVILLYLRLESRPVLAGVAGGLLLGGSLGNLWERLSRGEVTDFLKIPYWPTFNFADVFIVAGVVLVAISLLWPTSGEGNDG